MQISKQLRRLSAQNAIDIRGESTDFSLQRTSGRHTGHAALQAFLGEGEIQHHNRPNTFPTSTLQQQRSTTVCVCIQVQVVGVCPALLLTILFKKALDDLSLKTLDWLEWSRRVTP
ncbi:hypothetical protein PoB_006653500 [Plakobranchus ocellatus]|uniref:Uncharacterized protein n=1 Tax=Plakobranchus ocellatus TaxID=259542 RepID=A0AAV4D7D6_9GAST|nr:hypothetical protein PoB_006653500 [Plakobranchus ocellatus]